MNSVNINIENTRDKRLLFLLKESFSPESLEVINESHLHYGHKGSPGTGDSHYKIIIKAHAFDGLNRVAAHRLINDIVAVEFKSGLHALSLKIIK